MTWEKTISGTWPGHVTVRFGVDDQEIFHSSELDPFDRETYERTVQKWLEEDRQDGEAKAA